MKPMLGWFRYKGHPGDRTLEEQMTGLDSLIAEVPGKTVLDIGCAEGLISLALADAGAARVHGIDVIPRNIRDAKLLRGDRPVTFDISDANEYVPEPHDIVLLLAVLHKLRHPASACRRLANAAKSLCVMRIGKAGLHFTDVRSNFVPQDIGAVMSELGFTLYLETKGPHGDPTYFFRR